MPYLGFFGLEFVVTVKISTHKFFKSKLLTHMVNSGIGSTFSKDPEFGFSEGQGSDTL